MAKKAKEVATGKHSNCGCGKRGCGGKAESGNEISSSYSYSKGKAMNTSSKARQVSTSSSAKSSPAKKKTTKSCSS